MAQLKRSERQRNFEIMLIRLLVALRATLPKVLKSGGISRSQMIRVEKAAGDDAFVDSSLPSVTPEEWCDFLVAIARELDLVTSRDGRLQVELEGVDQFFAREDATRFAAVRDAWLKTGHFNEFFLIHSLEVGNTRMNSRQSGGSDCVPGAPEMRRMRAALLRFLEELPVDKWDPSEKLLSRIEAEQPEIMLSGQTHPLAHTPDYIGIRAKGASKDLPRAGNWQRVEGALLAEVLRFPAQALAFVDVEEANKKLRLRQASQDESSPGYSKEPLMIQPNYDVMALIPEMTTKAIWQLARVSSITSFGQAAHFKLEEPWVIQAINAGESVESIVEALTKASKTPLPQNVAYSIQEWGRRAERITIWLDAAFIEAEGIEDAAERLGEKGARDFESIAGKHAVMSTSALKQQRELLPARAVEIDYARSLPPVLRATADGVLALDNDGSHFRARQAVSRYAEEVGLDRFQVSKATLESAKRSGKSADAIVEELASLCSNDLPPLFEAKVRAWVQGDITALIGKPTVFHLSDERVATLLSRAPEAADAFGAALSLRNFSTSMAPKELVNRLRELGITSQESEELLLDVLEDRGSTSFAHSHRAPASRREGFDRFRFEEHLERGMTPALLYALSFREAVMASTSTPHLPELTLITPLAIWTDGNEAFVEADCRYLHCIEILRVNWLKTLEVQR